MIWIAEKTCQLFSGDSFLVTTNLDPLQIYPKVFPRREEVKDYLVKI